MSPRPNHRTDSPTERMWDRQNFHPGDRHRLFSAIADAFTVTKALYPGLFIDIAPSFVFDSVTFVDINAQALRFSKKPQESTGS